MEAEQGGHEVRTRLLNVGHAEGCEKKYQMWF